MKQNELLAEINKLYALKEEVNNEFQRLFNKFGEENELSKEEYAQLQLLNHLIKITQ